METIAEVFPDLEELKRVFPSGEDSKNQFKEDVRNEDSLAAEIVAFSNFKGGRIFIGVTDSGDIVGIPSAEVRRVNQLIAHAASQHVRSPVAVSTQNMLVAPDRVVIVLTVPKGEDRPHFDNQGVIWFKVGSNKKRVNSKEELRRLFQDSGLIHGDQMLMRAGIEALDLPLLSEFLREYHHERLPKQLPQRLQLLENMKLAINDQVNLAAILLFGKTPQYVCPQFIIKAAFFIDNSITSNYLDSEDFSGPMTRVFEGALYFIMRSLHKVQGNKSVNSLGDPEIPQIVFEELLVNALIHRDYLISAPIRLLVFNNRIEIISPGSLPDHLTVTKMKSGKSIQRNSVLTSFIAQGLLPYRGLGTGVRRALESWPKIKFINDRDGCLFTVIVERTIDSRIMGQNAPVNVSISDFQREILEIIKKDTTIPYEELAEQLGKGRATITRHIQQLKSEGVLRRLGSKTAGYWEVAAGILKTQDTPKDVLISDSQRELLEVIRKNTRVSYEELATQLGKDSSTIKRTIQQLKSDGILHRVGSKTTGYWEIRKGALAVKSDPINDPKTTLR